VRGAEVASVGVEVSVGVVWEEEAADFGGRGDVGLIGGGSDESYGWGYYVWVWAVFGVEREKISDFREVFKDSFGPRWYLRYMGFALVRNDPGLKGETVATVEINLEIEGGRPV
jgi:hypothetical protein